MRGVVPPLASVRSYDNFTVYEVRVYDDICDEVLDDPHLVWRVDRNKRS